MHDNEGMRHLFFEQTWGSRVYADSAYTVYQHEDDLALALGISLLSTRKSNSKLKRQLWEELLINHYQKRIETVFSDTNKLIPRMIRAVTAENFVLN